MKKKILSILFVLALTFALCSIICADEWTVSTDEKTLILNDVVYVKYDKLHPNDRFLPETSYIYDESYYRYYLKRNNDNFDVFSYNNTIYVSKQGEEALDSFVNLNFSEYKISSKTYFYYSDVSYDWINGLDGGNCVELDVRSLKNVTTHYVIGYDKTYTIAHTMGGLYELDGEYYFINYDKLSNDKFDANGAFSYVSGSVNAYKLSISQNSDVHELISNQNYFDSIYETDESYDYYDNDSSFSVGYFVFITVLFGYAIPLAIALIGIIRVFTKKTANPKRWYLLIGCLCGWILLSTCILLCLFF